MTSASAPRLVDDKQSAGKSPEPETTVPHSPKAASDDAAPEHRRPVCVPGEIAGDITESLVRLQNARERPLFALIAGQIDEKVWDQVYSWKLELRAAGQVGPVDILIHSPGGVLTPCYMVARFLAHCMSSWTALVPRLAASGATLITLGAHDIVMSHGAQLGPLDPQVISKRPQKFFTSERQSPLEALEWVSYVRELTFSSMDTSMHELLRQGVAPQRALESSIEIATRVARPLLERIEPYDLAALRLDSRLARLYCERVARPTDTSKQTQRNANYEALVEFFPAHEFAIDIVEARDGLKFNVDEPNDKIELIFDELRAKLTRPEAYIGLVPADSPSRG